MRSWYLHTMFYFYLPKQPVKNLKITLSNIISFHKPIPLSPHVITDKNFQSLKPSLESSSSRGLSSCTVVSASKYMKSCLNIVLPYLPEGDVKCISRAPLMV